LRARQRTVRVIAVNRDGTVLPTMMHGACADR
jgi:hypothetical protein